MVTQELADYVSARRKERFSDDRIRHILQAANYNMNDVNEALGAGNMVAQPAQPIQGPAPTGPQAVAPIDPVSRPEPAFTPMAPSQETGPRVMMGVTIAAIVIILLGGGAFAYFHLSSGGLSSAQVIDGMLRNGFLKISAAQTAEDLNIAVHYKYTPQPAGATNPYATMFLGTGSSNFSVAMNASGSFDMSDPNNRKFDEHVLLTIGGAAQNITIVVGGELRLVGQTLYLNITNVPNLGFFDPSTIQNKWIKFDVPTSTVSAASTTLTQSNVNNIIVALEKTFQIVKTLPDATIGGDTTYHYEYSINKDGLKQMLQVAATIANPTSTASSTVAAESAADNLIDTLTNAGGELWIGKTDLFPRRVSIGFSFATTTSGYAAESDFLSTSTYTNINQPQDIEAPAGAVDWTQVMKSMTGASPVQSVPINPSKPSSS